MGPQNLYFKGGDSEGYPDLQITGLDKLLVDVKWPVTLPDLIVAKSRHLS